MNCPYCGELLDSICDENGNPDITHCFCLNTSCNFFGESVPNKIWQDLTDGKEAQSELNYYKGLNCPTVVEKQMQTITKLSKQLAAAQWALNAIHDALGLDMSDEELDKIMIVPAGLHIIKRIVNQGLVDGKKAQPEKD